MRRRRGYSIEIDIQDGELYRRETKRREAEVYAFLREEHHDRVKTVEDDEQRCRKSLSNYFMETMEHERYREAKRQQALKLSTGNSSADIANKYLELFVNSRKAERERRSAVTRALKEERMENTTTMKHQSKKRNEKHRNRMSELRELRHARIMEERRQRHERVEKRKDNILLKRLNQKDAVLEQAAAARKKKQEQERQYVERARENVLRRKTVFLTATQFLNLPPLKKGRPSVFVSAENYRMGDIDYESSDDGNGWPGTTEIAIGTSDDFPIDSDDDETTRGMATRPNPNPRVVDAFDAAIVKETWSKINGDLAGAGKLFYDQLFEIAPDAKPLFAKVNMDNQFVRLMEMLDAAVGMLDNTEGLIPALMELGQRHRSYGTTEAHYPLVGQALIATLKIALGEDFTAEVEGAWVRTYGTISSIMIDGAAAADAEAEGSDAAIVKETWSKINGDLAGAGKLFYDQLFEIAPDAKPLFVKVNMDNQFVRLMEMLDAAVGMLDNTERLIPALMELGKRHRSYGTTEAHYPLVGQALIATLKIALGEDFTAEVEGAWVRTYGAISSIMIDGAAAADAEAEGSDAAIVKETWSKINGDLAGAGKLFYDQLFEIAPDAKPLFAKVNMDNQFVRLMEMLDAAVGMLDNTERLIPALMELGKRHRSYGTTEAHYPLVGQALIAMLKIALGEEFTAEVEGAWVRTYGTISSIMIDGAAEDEGTAVE